MSQNKKLKVPKPNFMMTAPLLEDHPVWLLSEYWRDGELVKKHMFVSTTKTIDATIAAIEKNQAENKEEFIDLQYKRSNKESLYSTFKFHKRNWVTQEEEEWEVKEWHFTNKAAKRMGLC